MRLLIAGWQGQLARALVEAAPARRDVTACAVGRPALDICEIRTIERALSEHNPDVVINTAGYTAVDAAEDDEARALALNCEGARLLAESAARRGAAVIQLSTDYVFDGSKAGAYRESDAPAPRTVYGRSRLAGEAAVAKANPRHVILRTGWILSTGPSGFIANVVRRGADTEPLRFVADQRGSPGYAPDIACAILDVAARMHDRDETDSRWGLYHIANAGSASWHDIASEIAANVPGLADRAIVAIASSDYPSRAERPRNATLDCARISDAFDIRLRHWRQAVRDAIARIRTPS